jgi:hypothetical protein
MSRPTTIDDYKASSGPTSEAFGLTAKASFVVASRADISVAAGAPVGPAAKVLVDAALEAPTARPIPAWGEAPCTDRQKARGLKARPIPTSIPDVSFNELDTIIPQKRAKLIPKILLRMMNLLRINVRNQRVQIRRPNRKRPIFFLPFEPRQARRLRLQPFRRTFQFPYQFRNGYRTRQPNSEMNMIGNASHPITFAFGVTSNGRKIRIKRGTQRSLNNRHTLLRTKDHMNQNVRERLCHRGDYGLHLTHRLT